MGPTDELCCFLVGGLVPLNCCALIQFPYQESTCDGDLEEMPSWPFIFAKGGGFLTAKSFTVCIDNVPLMHASSPREAFKVLFLAHFAFNVAYPKETSLTLEFTQRSIATINPGRGTKVERTRGKQHNLNPKVASLISTLKDYDF
uniref:Tick transposon n=1 Tax=Rhipicephalus appendiculatus TaxID=34631 RepID=A0A131YZX6_RHIAP